MTRSRKPWEFGREHEDWPKSYNTRPAWEKIDPKDGMPAWEALYHFVDKDKSVRLFELDRDGYPISGYGLRTA